MTVQEMNKLRLGEIDFTNVWPVFHYFPFGRFEKWLDVLTLPPTGLNRAIAKDKIDVAPISSFAYAELADKLVLLPDLSVSADQQVKSILLFHKKPIDQLDGCVVSLTNASATSVNMLKIILHKFMKVTPHYQTEEPDLHAMMQHADACLLIGDDAIRASWENEGTYLVSDLATLWHAHTGFGMTFAVWAVRKEIAATHEEQLTQVTDAFYESRRKATLDLDPIVARAQQLLGGESAYWRDYFTTLTYTFDEQQQRGLQVYYEYAYELGLLQKPVQLQFWSKS
jgi:chorismate dehydratase